jgi:hypothetical protein
MKLSNERWGDESKLSLIPFPRRDELGEIRKKDLRVAGLYMLGNLEQIVEWNTRRAKRLMARYAEKPRGESLEAQLRNFLEAQEIVGCMMRSNRVLQLFNLKIGNPPNLDLPFTLD